jgi:hypothetical protein
MSPINFIRKELSAAWHEANRPLFPEGSDNNHFYTELFNYYHSLKGKTIDTRNGESLFPLIIDHVQSSHGEQPKIVKVVNRTVSEISVAPDFNAGNWEPV